jgi:hypothetical protein
MRFVFRHFPLTTMHPFAELAAEAAEAAAAQGWQVPEAECYPVGARDMNGRVARMPQRKVRILGLRKTREDK